MFHSFARKFKQPLQTYGRKFTGFVHSYGRKIQDKAEHYGNKLKGSNIGLLQDAGHAINKHVANTAHNIASAARHLDENNVAGALNQVRASHYTGQLHQHAQNYEMGFH